MQWEWGTACRYAGYIRHKGWDLWPNLTYIYYVAWCHFTPTAHLLLYLHGYMTFWFLIWITLTFLTHVPTSVLHLHISQFFIHIVCFNFSNGCNVDCLFNTLFYFSHVCKVICFLFIQCHTTTQLCRSQLGRKWNYISNCASSIHHIPGWNAAVSEKHASRNA